MSDLPSTPPPKAPQAVAPTPVALGDPSPQQNPDKQLAGDKSTAEPSRDLANAPAVTLSASVAGLREGATISGQVAGADANGRPTVVSDNATFAVLSDTTLKVGQAVVLGVTATSPGLKASLTTVDSKPPPRAQELRLAVIDVPADRLAARAKIDAAIAPQATTRGSEASPTQENSRALFLGLSADSAIKEPPFAPGSTLDVSIERVVPPKPKDAPPAKEAPQRSPIVSTSADLASPLANSSTEATATPRAAAEPLIRLASESAAAEDAASREPRVVPASVTIETPAPPLQTPPTRCRHRRHPRRPQRRPRRSLPPRPAPAPLVRRRRQ